LRAGVEDATDDGVAGGRMGPALDDIAPDIPERGDDMSAIED
jgi:hypothetical protein